MAVVIHCQLTRALWPRPALDPCQRSSTKAVSRHVCAQLFTRIRLTTQVLPMLFESIAPHSRAYVVTPNGSGVTRLCCRPNCDADKTSSGRAVHRPCHRHDYTCYALYCPTHRT
eukprot:4886359-Amphidinium_carterae.1